MNKNVLKTNGGVKISFTGEVEKQNIVKMVENCATGQCECMSDETKEKLRIYGIAPPVGSSKSKRDLLNQSEVCCPRCASKNTNIKSMFGSTACKALYVCSDCLEPFDYFKCI